jgi:hypothetical protein
MMNAPFLQKELYMFAKFPPNCNTSTAPSRQGLRKSKLIFILGTGCHFGKYFGKPKYFGEKFSENHQCMVQSVGTQRVWTYVQFPLVSLSLTWRKVGNMGTGQNGRLQPQRNPKQCGGWLPVLWGWRENRPPLWSENEVEVAVVSYPYISAGCYSGTYNDKVNRSAREPGCQMTSLLESLGLWKMPSCIHSMRRLAIGWSP